MRASVYFLLLYAWFSFCFCTPLGSSSAYFQCTLRCSLWTFLLFNILLFTDNKWVDSGILGSDVVYFLQINGI